VGGLYGMRVCLDSSLASEGMIAFNGGTHRDEVHMRTADYARQTASRHGW
jgi:prolyl-tRNA editing enzyme YbaK/EbsC (Cys-tRNA(Pro) deacylase)